VGTVIYHMFFQCFNLLPGGLILVQTFICVMIPLCVSSYHVAQNSTVIMGDGSYAFVHGVVTVDLKLTLGKIVQLKNVQYIPSINKNLVSCFLLCRDGFKVMLESSKFVVSKCG
jgi:hypothetical protein